MKDYLKKNPHVINLKKMKLKGDLNNRYKGHIFHRILGVAPPKLKSVVYPDSSDNDLMVVEYTIKQIQGNMDLINKKKLVPGPQLMNTWLQPIASKMTDESLKVQRKAWTAWHMPWGGYGKTINFGTGGNGLHEYVLQKGAYINVKNVQPAERLIKKYINEIFKRKTLTFSAPSKL